MVEVLPSILAADFARLGEEIARVESAGARILHVDIMDGHFVPNISIGPPVVESIRKVTGMAIEVHLMISDPYKYAPAFIDAGAERVLVHQEATAHLDRVLNLIQSRGAAAGVVLNPATPISMLEDVLELTDEVLLMSVNPGFGGQSFIRNTLKKARTLAARRKELGLQFPIEVDGGATRENIAEIVTSGIDWVVAGTSIFHSVNSGAAFQELTGIAREAMSVKV